jgi:hypothetical protein
MKTRQIYPNPIMSSESNRALWLIHLFWSLPAVSKMGLCWLYGTRVVLCWFIGLSWLVLQLLKRVHQLLKSPPFPLLRKEKNRPKKSPPGAASLRLPSAPPPCSSLRRRLLFSRLPTKVEGSSET